MDPITPRSLILDSYSDEYIDNNFRFSGEKLHELEGEIEGDHRLQLINTIQYFQYAFIVKFSC